MNEFYYYNYSIITSKMESTQKGPRVLIENHSDPLVWFSPCTADLLISVVQFIIHSTNVKHPLFVAHQLGIWYSVEHVHTTCPS